MPTLAKVQMLLALASPQPFPFGKYSPDQPRVPAGNPDGGQWAAEDGTADSPEKPTYSVVPARHTRGATDPKHIGATNPKDVVLDEGSIVVDSGGNRMQMPGGVSLNGIWGEHQEHAKH